MTKGILVHQCFSIDMGEPVPPRKKPKRKKGQPAYVGPICKCREMIDPETAEYWIEKGLAEWAGKGQVGVTGRTKKTPRSASIEKAHMERAYIDNDKEEAARIEEYGLITVLSRLRIGKYYATLKTEPVGGRRHDYGRSIIYMPENNRTVGGIGITQ